MTTLAAGTSTTISLAVGQSLFFSPGGNGLAVLSGGQKAGEQYKIGPSPVEIGPFSQVQSVSVSAVAPVGYFILPIDAANDLPAWPVTVDAAGNVSDPRIQGMVSGGGKRKNVLTKPTSGAVNATATPNTTSTFLMVTACPVPYYAVRLHWQHYGKDGTIGAATGIKCIVGGSDNVGSLDFTDLAAAAFKKCSTPNYQGSEFNTLVTDGSPGWKAVTWGGAATAAVADPGAGKTLVVSSDVTYVQGYKDEANDCYPLLVRYINGTGGFSYSNNLTGQQVGGNWISDHPGQPLVQLSRSTADAVTTPAGWSQGNTPSATGSGPLLYIEYFTAEGVISVDMVMDSRGNVSSEFDLTRQYLAAESYTYRALKAAEVPACFVRHSISGGAVFGPNTGTPAKPNYWVNAIPAQSLAAPAGVLVYLIYSVNDGILTSALASQVIARAAEFTSRALATGQKVILINAFPKTGYLADELLQLEKVTAFAKASGDAVFDALAEYGTPTGDWARFSFDANHMTDVGYQDVGEKLAALITRFA